MSPRLPHRRRRTVLWGGRPGLDVQVGSSHDRSRQARLRAQADLVRAFKPAAEAMRVAIVGAGRTGRTFAGVQRDLTRIGDALRVAERARPGASNHGRRR